MKHKPFSTCIAGIALAGLVLAVSTGCGAQKSGSDMSADAYTKSFKSPPPPNYPGAPGGAPAAPAPSKPNATTTQ